MVFPESSFFGLLAVLVKRWATVTLLSVAACIVLSANVASAQVELYAKQVTLPQTMLSTRSRLDRWRQTQQDAHSAIRVANWVQAAIKVGESVDGQLVTQIERPLGNRPDEDTTRWMPCKSDPRGNPDLAGSAAGFLFTTITADRPVTLTIELSRHEPFGGFAYRPRPCGAGVQPSDALVWLNGRRVALHNKLNGYRRVPVAKRRGWHDAVLVDLPLVSGENRLLLSLGKRSPKVWFNAVQLDPNPVPVLWSMVEHDFNRSEHRLLETVHFDWFDADLGWFCDSQHVKFETELLEQLGDEIGNEGRSILRRLLALTIAKTPPSDARWLDLCVTACQLRAALRDTETLHAAVVQLDDAYPETYPGAQLLADVAQLRRRLVRLSADRLDPTHAPSQSLLRELSHLRRQALVVQNPLLSDKRLLLVKRPTYDSNHYYDEYNAGIRRFGGNLCILSLDDGQVTELAPQLDGGLFDRYDLSFDAQRVVFNYKPYKPQGFRVYEIGVDGKNLRQLTTPPQDENQRIATYATCSWEDLQRDPCRYGHWTDDMHPCYLPDGRIVFTSTRSQRSVLCGGHALTVPNLYRIDADGTNLHQLSQGALSEFCPSVMNDGRILYNRWEYVDKGAGAVQSLWAMYPDGSRSVEIYGNNITTPGVFTQAQHVAGADHLVACLGAGHCPGNIGAILLVDLDKNKRTENAMTALTPTCIPKGNWGMRQHRNGRWMVDVYGPWYSDPYPLTDPDQEKVAGKFFLVSGNPDQLWNDPAAYDIYVLDVFGNRVLLYDDPEISCWQARPLEARGTPPSLQGATQLADDQSESPRATLLLTDVYEGLDEVAPGQVKYLRVMEQIPRPWSAYLGYQSNDAAPGQMVAISLYTHLSVKVLHGIVPVHEDGSAYFSVPADRNIFLQALDEDFMEIQRMRTFVNFQPGERRSCIGCHEHRNRAPVNRAPLALADSPVRPRPQPGEVAPRPLHYPSDVQPIFDRHCVSCHGKEQPDGDLDLTGEMTDLFCHSYEEIINKNLVDYIQEFVGPKKEGADAMGYAPAVPPYTYGSHQSRLIQVLRQGHYDVQLGREDLIKLVTWIDSNAPYYGSYFGRRNVTSRYAPDFRATPTLRSALGNRE